MSWLLSGRRRHGHWISFVRQRWRQACGVAAWAVVRTIAGAAQAAMRKPTRIQPRRRQGSVAAARVQCCYGGGGRCRRGGKGPRAGRVAWWWCLGHRTPKLTQAKRCSNKCVPRARQQFSLRLELAALSPVGEYPQGLGIGSSLVPCAALSGKMCPRRYGSSVVAAPHFTIRCRSGRRGPRADHIACGGAWGIGFEGGPAEVIRWWLGGLAQTDPCWEVACFPLSVASPAPARGSQKRGEAKTFGKYGRDKGAKGKE